MSNDLGGSRAATGMSRDAIGAALNDGLGTLDAAITGSLSVEVDNTNTVTLTALQFVSNVNFTLIAAATPPSGAVTVNVPAVHGDASALVRGNFNLINELARDATVQVSGQSATAPVVTAGTSAGLTMDGANVRSIAVGTAGAGGGATDLDDLTDVDLTTTAPSGGDTLVFDSASGMWLPGASAGGGGGGKIAQVVNTQTGALATGTATIPGDDTIPQQTEGTEFMTLAITPTNASSKLIIEGTLNFSLSGTGTCAIALFRDAGADALLAVEQSVATGWVNAQRGFTVMVNAGSVAATTFKLRAGPESALTLTVNGFSGARRLGGVNLSSLTITEILP